MTIPQNSSQLLKKDDNQKNTFLEHLNKYLHTVDPCPQNSNTEVTIRGTSILGWRYL